jgi:hypothetical protein
MVKLAKSYRKLSITAVVGFHNQLELETDQDHALAIRLKYSFYK